MRHLFVMDDDDVFLDDFEDCDIFDCYDSDCSGEERRNIKLQRRLRLACINRYDLIQSRKPKFLPQTSSNVSILGRFPELRTNRQRSVLGL